MINHIYKHFLKFYIQAKFKNDIQSLIPLERMYSRLVSHQKKMPDLLGLGIKTISFIYLTSFYLKKIFYSNFSFINAINQTRTSKIILFRNLIRFHDSLFEVANVDEHNIQNELQSHFINKTNLYDFIVVGSGPGGAISAKFIQDSKFNSCIIEKGNISNNDLNEFSYNQMLSQYNYGGITTTLGDANIAYTEGSAFGGGSEINSGLYHRTPESILKIWQESFDLKSTLTKDLIEHFESIEKKLCVSYFPEKFIPKASLKLKKGSEILGLDVREIPRWYKYKDTNSTDGIKMTMSKTYLMDYKNNGGKIFQNTKVKKILKVNQNWELMIETNGNNQVVRSKNIILSAGAIGTPQILIKSGLSNKAGNYIQMHPTIKVVALFDEEVNEEGMGVPVHQTKELNSDYSFGCSISSKTYLKLAMLDHFRHKDIIDSNWKKMAIYYVMIKPQGCGKIKNYPYFNDPVIKYKLTKLDIKNLSDGLKLLCEVLLKAGAETLFPCFHNSPVIQSIHDINKLPSSLNVKNSSLMSVHLFSSCPIGENKKKCVANSYGKVFGHDGLFISDGSMLPSAPGVNPQGTIMAIAHRNIQKIIAAIS